MNPLRNYLQELLSWKYIFFIAAFSFFGWINRGIVIQNSASQNAKINIWDVWLSQLMNATFLTYILLPICVSFSVLTIHRNYSLSILFRTRSWSGWLLYSLKLHLPFSLAIVTYFVLTSGLMTNGANFEIVWSPFSKSPMTSLNWISSIGMNTGLAPHWFLLIHIIQLLLFLIFTHVFLSCCYLLFPHIYFLMSMGLFIFLYGAVSLRYFPDTYITLYRYMAIAASRFLFPSILHAILILFVLILIIFTGTAYLKKNTLGLLRRQFVNNYGYILYVIILLIGLTRPFNGVRELTVWDFIYSRFYGLDSSKDLVLYVFLYYVIIFIGFTYIQTLRINSTLMNHFLYSLIRHKSYWHWFSVYATRLGYINLMFITILTLITLLVGTWSGLSWRPVITIFPQLSVSNILYHMFINGWLQLINYQLIVFIICWLSSRPAIRISGVTGLIAISLPWVNSGWLPGSLNAMGYLSGSWKDTLQTTAVLIVWLALILALISYLFSKRNQTLTY